MDNLRKEADVQIPAVSRLITRLQEQVNRCESIVFETRDKLQTLKINEELKEPSGEEEAEQSYSAVEQIDRLISRLETLNDKASSNLKHLHGIV